MFSIKTFRYVALAEATSFLILLVVAYIVHSEGGVNVMGPLHGTLFLAYVVIGLAVARAAAWSTKQTALVLLGAVLPFGGFVVDRWLARTGQLETA